MDQPDYWADKSIDKPDSKQYVEESQRLKMNGGNSVVIERGTIPSGLYILHIVGGDSGLEFNDKLSLN